MPHLHEGQMIVSFAAGIPLHQIEAVIPSSVFAVRVMPNALSLIGQGMNPVAYGASVSAQAQMLVQSMLRTLGLSIVVNDAQMNWCVGLTGAAMRSLLPALEGMTKAGVEAGFTEKEARHMAARVMLGTAAMAATRDLSFDELKSLTPMETLDETALHENLYGSRSRCKRKNRSPPAKAGARLGCLIPKEAAMKIEVLGTGCYNCVKLETLIDEVLTQLGKTDVDVVRVDNETRIRHLISADEIPGLLIDGVLASVREIPARETLVEWLSGVSVPGAK